MDMPLAQPSPSKFRQFLRTWRREIIRGGVLFGLVVFLGIAVSRVNIGMNIPWGALRSVGDFDFGHDGDLFGGNRAIGDPWEFRTEMQPSQHVWIRNTNGPVEVLAGTANELEVFAEKSWRKSSPSSVEVVAVPTERGVTICALWSARERRCGPDGEYQMNGVRKNDVAVRFTVKLPRGVPLDVSTVNGPVAIEGVSAPVEVNTMNGRIRVHTTVGPVKATTINGSIEAMVEAFSGGDIELKTVNGSVTAAVPRGLAAVIDAETVNGRVETDFPVQVTGKISPRHLRGTIGRGATVGAASAGLPTLKLSTVNGSITIREAPPGEGPPRGRAPASRRLPGRRPPADAPPPRR